MAREKVIPVPSPPAEFSENEEAVLRELYAVSDGSYNLYSLALKLHPDAKAGTEAAQEVFEQVRGTFEGLVARGIVAGKRLAGADGVYFDALRLTAKGERNAIESKNRPKAIAIRVEFIESKNN